MEDLLKKIIAVSNIEDEDIDLFTEELYKYIGKFVKKQMKLNKETKSLMRCLEKL